LWDVDELTFLISFEFLFFSRLGKCFKVRNKQSTYILFYEIMFFFFFLNKKCQCKSLILCILSKTFKMSECKRVVLLSILKEKQQSTTIWKKSNKVLIKTDQSNYSLFYSRKAAVLFVFCFLRDLKFCFKHA
jgi:hypothetical protein